MRKTAHELMLIRVHEIVDAAGMRHEFDTEPRFHLRLEQGGYHPLEVESWPSPDPLVAGEQRRIRIGHYLTQNGEKKADLELEMNDRGSSLTLKQWTGYPYRIIYRDPVTQQVKINLQLRHDVADLLLMWARNIRAQGWIQVASRLVSGNTEGQGQRLLPALSGMALAIDLEVADPEGSTVEDDDEWGVDYDDILSTVEGEFASATETPRQACLFLERDIWDGHLRILLPGQSKLTLAQKGWLNADADIAWYTTSLIPYPDLRNIPASASQ